MSDNIHQFFPRTNKNSDAASAYALGHEGEFKSADRLLSRLKTLLSSEACLSAGLFGSTASKHDAPTSPQNNVTPFRIIT